MIQPVIRQALDQIGATIADIGFTVSGSSDYLAGQAFSFVMTLDAVGAWPPIMESHVEMDGAWALYEAWLKIQAGHADTALIYSYSKASPGDLPRVLSPAARPVLLRPAVAGLGRVGRACRPGTCSTRARSPRPRWPGSPTATARRPAPNPHAQVKGSKTVDELLGEDYLSRSAAAPRLPADLRRRRGDHPRRRRPGREWVDRPAWIRGIDHRVDSHSFGARDITRAPSIAQGRRRWPASTAATIDVAELHAPFTHQEKIVRHELSLGDDVVVNPSGGPLAANADDGRRPRAHRRGGQPDHGSGRPTAGSPTPPAGTCCNRTSSRCWRATEMSANRRVPSSGSVRPSTPRSGATCRCPACSARPSTGRSPTPT